MQNLPVIWVIGGPGSGKGTLCELLSKNHNFYHISIGNLLRDEVKLGSNLGQEIEDIMESGELVDMISPVDVVLFLEVSETTMKKRLQNRAKSSHRIDDNESSIQKRIFIQNKLINDILKTFESKLIKISAEQSIEEVYNDAIKVLEDYIIPKENE
ncbi:hypothetical protein PGB90_003223 [Kerria lacca]